MANGGGLTSAQGPQGHLTYLSWDESATCVLGMMASWRACRGHTATAWNGDEEHEPYQHFPRRFGCAGPVGRARAGRACAGAIAGAVGRSGARGDAQPGAGSHDPFGEPFTLEPKKVVILKGTANWDAAFDTLIDSFKALTALLDKQGIKATGNSMIVYTSTDDTGFTFLAEIPVDQDPKNLTKDMSIGKSPEGKALKFVHRGSYDNMDNTYEAITNHLDDKKLEAKDTFIEEYITDPLKTAEDKLVINVYVPLK